MAQTPSSASIQPRVVALIVAAGRGVRAGGSVPKQYRQLADAPVLAHTLRAFLRCSLIDLVQVVIHNDDMPLYEQALDGIDPPARNRIARPACGGATRMQTVSNGLAALDRLAGDGDIVLIHDAARPFVSQDMLGQAIAAASLNGAAVPVLAVTDTVKRLDATGNVFETLDRSSLRTVQTPQAFRFGLIRAAHAQATNAGRDDATDDGRLIEWAGLPLATFPGDPDNIKLTTAEDFIMAEARIATAAMAMTQMATTRMATAPVLLTRVATGYDVHAFGEGDHVWLCGMKIPHDQGVLAHSDGDVALHALCDALFGVMGDGDIGVHFPPSDPRWRGASSDQFLAFACARLRARGGVIDHLDISMVCERPKIGPYRAAMLARIAEIAAVRPDQIGLKATTSEGLGFTGRAEGLAALATVTVRLPEPGGSEAKMDAGFVQ